MNQTHRKCANIMALDIRIDRNRKKFHFVSNFSLGLFLLLYVCDRIHLSSSSSSSSSILATQSNRISNDSTINLDESSDIKRIASGQSYQIGKYLKFFFRKKNSLRPNSDDSGSNFPNPISTISNKAIESGCFFVNKR